MNKLDKAIKEETKRLYRDYVVKMQVDELVEWVEQSNKRIAKAALEASKLEEKKINDMFPSSNVMSRGFMGSLQRYGRILK